MPGIALQLLANGHAGGSLYGRFYQTPNRRNAH